jgi:hypothetical protein
MKKLFFILLMMLLCFACRERHPAENENLLFDFAVSDIVKLCIADNSRGYIHYAAKDSLPPIYASNFQHVYFDKIVSVCCDSLIPYGSVMFWLYNGNVLDYKFFQKQNDILKCYVVMPDKDTVIMPFQPIDRILAVDRY